jgi:uncharacterized protein YnzC (UPF0291/DUF896 family)
VKEMNNYTWQYIQNHTNETKRLLGIDYEQLGQLLELGKLLHQRQQEEIEKTKKRLIRPGGGNHPKLSEEEQIILMLVYLRHNITFQLLGMLFQVSESTAHNLFNYWQKIFEGELPYSLLEQVKKSLEEAEQVREDLTEYELIVDSAEQAIERPSDYQEQKKYYSGKQKRHTFKNQFIVLPSGSDIVDVVIGEHSPASDINICRQTLNKFESEQQLIGDKAYIGEAQISTPSKKPKNGELTTQEKEENKELSSRRIYVEHLIRVVKIFKVAQERFRLRKSRYKSVILTVCGLVRLRMGSLILEVIKLVDLGETIDVKLSHSFEGKLDLVPPNTY